MMMDRRHHLVSVLALLGVLLFSEFSTAAEIDCPEGASQARGAAIDWGHSSAFGVEHAIWCEAAGIRNGLYRDFYPDGQVFREVWFKDGKKSGEMVTYYASGKMWSRRRYEDDRLVGPSTTWHENGKVAELATYELRNGASHGRFESWDADGRKVAAGTLLNGKPHGTMTTFDENGHPKRAYEYVLGTRVGVKELE